MMVTLSERCLNTITIMMLWWSPCQRDVLFGCWPGWVVAERPGNKCTPLLVFFWWFVHSFKLLNGGFWYLRGTLGPPAPLGLFFTKVGGRGCVWLWWRRCWWWCCWRWRWRWRWQWYCMRSMRSKAPVCADPGRSYRGDKSPASSILPWSPSSSSPPSSVITININIFM